MKNWLSAATKKRVIQEIKRILYEHPRYRGDSGNVQNKFSFDERPQRGVIVNGTSADRVRLSANNYVGRVSSFVMQANLENYPNTTIEWVIENQGLLGRYSPKRDVFPTPPGVYIIEIEEVPDVGRNLPGKFYIDPILTEFNEPLIKFQTTSDTTAQLSRENIYPQSVRLWLDGRLSLAQGVDYSVDHESGQITFLKPTPPETEVYADYRYQLEKQGPFDFYMESTDMEVIPGAIIAFGDRPQKCDKIPIVVSATRAEVHEVYGGKFEMNFDLTVFSRDAEDREKLSDYIIIKILEVQNHLGWEGLELMDVSPGGESEEIYVESIDDYFYDGAVSLSMRVDWEIYVPLPVEIFRVVSVSKTEEQEKGYMDGTYTDDLFKAIANPIELAGSVISIGNQLSFERIK